jgi:hypothetical protein
MNCTDLYQISFVVECVKRPFECITFHLSDFQRVDIVIHIFLVYYDSYMVIVQLVAQKYYEYSTPVYFHAVHAWSKIAISILYYIATYHSLVKIQAWTV